jgi:hypothetical protein
MGLPAGGVHIAGEFNTVVPITKAEAKTGIINKAVQLLEFLVVCRSVQGGRPDFFLPALQLPGFRMQLCKKVFCKREVRLVFTPQPKMGPLTL